MNLNWMFDRWRDVYTTSQDWHMEVGDFQLYRTDAANWHLIRCKVDGWYSCWFYRSPDEGKAAAERIASSEPVDILAR